MRCQVRRPRRRRAMDVASTVNSNHRPSTPSEMPSGFQAAVSGTIVLTQRRCTVVSVTADTMCSTSALSPSPPR